MLKDPKRNSELLVDYFNTDILPRTIDLVNIHFASRRLAKLGRNAEPLPIEQRQLSSYRTRLGTMLEYSLGSEIDKIIEENCGEDAKLTHAFVHEYPDFYLRTRTFERILRIEMKAVDSESDEHAARFDAPTSVIDHHADFVLFVGWERKKEKSNDGIEWEHPSIFAFVFVPAIELAKERDLRLIEIGGKIEGDQVLVPSTKHGGRLGPDPGNYGKIWRIVQPKRMNAPDLSLHVKRFLDFLGEVDQRAPRKRLRGYRSNEGETRLDHFARSNTSSR